MTTMPLTRGRLVVVVFDVVAVYCCRQVWTVLAREQVSHHCLLTILDIALNVILALFVVLIHFLIGVEIVLMMVLMTMTMTISMLTLTVSSTEEMTLVEKMLVTLVKKIHSFVFLSVVYQIVEIALFFPRIQNLIYVRTCFLDFYYGTVDVVVVFLFPSPFPAVYHM